MRGAVPGVAGPGASEDLQDLCGLTPTSDCIPAGRGWATDESACTPGSVHGCLTASRWAAIHLGLPLPAGSSGPPAGIGRAALERLRRTAADRRPSRPCSGWGLPSRAGHPVRWWSLTPPFHPHRRRTAGGLFSVALSRGSPRVAVSDHPALWSPDVPRRRGLPRRRDRPADSSVVPPTLVLPCRGEVHGLVTASTCRQDDAAVIRGLPRSRASRGCPPSAYGFSCSTSASWAWCCRSSSDRRSSRSPKRGGEATSPELLGPRVTDLTAEDRPAAHRPPPAPAAWRRPR